MRFALWRKGKEKAQAEKPVAKPAPVPAPAKVVAPSPSGDIELRVLGEALSRRRRWIIVPTLIALVLSVAIVNLITPRYKSEARILIDGRENVFLGGAVMGMSRRDIRRRFDEIVEFAGIAPFLDTPLKPRDRSFMRTLELCMIENWVRNHT